MESKYHQGDTVKVVDYGEMATRQMPCNNCGQAKWWDALPSVVGKTGIVEQVIFASGIPLYVLSGIPEKAQFYDEQQLRLI